MIVAKPPDNQRSLLCAQNVGLTVSTKCRTVCRTTPYCEGARPLSHELKGCNTTTRPSQSEHSKHRYTQYEHKEAESVETPEQPDPGGSGARFIFRQSLLQGPRCVESRLWHAKTRRTERTRMWDRGGLVCYIMILTHAKKRNYLFVDMAFFQSAHSFESTENQTAGPLQLSQSVKS